MNVLQPSAIVPVYNSSAVLLQPEMQGRITL